jgi:hypothetical protein
MKRLSQSCPRLSQLRLPTLALLTLLQRTPALRFALAVGDYVLESPAGALLKSAAASVAALGAIDSVAGASSTGLAYTYTLLTGTPGHPSPYSVIVNAAISPVAFVLQSSPAQNPPQSWAIAGNIPPGIQFGTATSSVSGTGGLVNLANPTLFGTPTQTGAYKMILQAYQLANGGGYYSTVFDYEIVVTQAPVAPAFTTQPASLTLPEGSNAVFTVVTSGAPEPTYQWTLNGQPISGATASSLTIDGVAAINQGNYACVATNSVESVTSATATLTVISPTLPAFSVQPSGLTVGTGATAVFTASASGSPVPTYQWTFNGAPIAGATRATLIVSGATAASQGAYACVATNSVGSTASAAAALAVSPTQDLGRIVNISCRAGVGTGANILIAGFVSGGAGTSGTEPVLVRATGPGLQSFGVTGTLPDPSLSLYQGTSVVQSNTGWGGSPTIAAEDTAVHAFALSPTSKDSALFIPNLSPGAYTAQVLGASGDTGVSLAEVYDATPDGTYTPASPRIVNISARVQVGTGGSILIAGFAIGGSTSKTVLIRASGPALVPLGVTGALPDPALTLYSGTSVLASNSGWGGDPSIISTAASVGAFTWNDAASADSALLVSLPPGAYTVQVAGAAGTANDTGIALVEVYDVP